MPCASKTQEQAREESLSKPLLIMKPDLVCTRLVVVMVAAVASEGAVGYFGVPEEACLHSPPLLSWA